MPQTADPVRLAEMVRTGAYMRTGRKLGRTLYLRNLSDDYETDLCVGIVDSTELAGEIMRRWNLVQVGIEHRRKDDH